MSDRSPPCLARRPARLVRIGALVLCACSAGDEGSTGSLSAGPYMPGADATDAASSTGESPPDAGGDETTSASSSSTGSGAPDCSDPTCATTTGPSIGSTGEGSTDDAGPTMSCGELAVARGFVVGACESGGNGACDGAGTPTIDCDFCCDLCPGGDTCGALAMTNGWAAAACETPGNPACGGIGTPTCDCAVCCEQ